MDVISLVFSGSSWAVMLCLLVIASFTTAAYLYLPVAIPILQHRTALRRAATIASFIVLAALWLTIVALINLNYDIARSKGAPIDEGFFISAVLFAALVTLIGAIILRPPYRLTYRAIHSKRIHSAA